LVKQSKLVKKTVSAESKPYRINSSGIIIIAFLFSIIIILFIFEDNRRHIEDKLVAHAQPPSKSGQSVSSGIMEEIRHLKDLVKQNPEDAKAIIRLGNNLFDISRYDEAIYYYQLALNIDSRNPDVLIDAGVASVNLGKVDQAVAYMVKALEVHPHHKLGLYNLGIIYFNMNNRVESIKYLEELIRMHPGSREAENAGRLLQEIKN
jgi:tetratricopeptide (TPR) repeat protein